MSQTPTPKIFSYACTNCGLQWLKTTEFEATWLCRCGWWNQLDQVGTRQFKTGATRDVDTDKLDYEGFISPLVDRRYAEYMHQCRLRNIPLGQTIRASDNWQKGIPKETYAKSLVRHVNEFRLIHDGFEAFDEKGNLLALEDVLCAIRFNADGYLFEILKGKQYGRTGSQNDTARVSGGALPQLPDSKSVKSEVKAVRDVPQKGTEYEDLRCATCHRFTLRLDGSCRWCENNRRLAEDRSGHSANHVSDSDWRSQGDGCASEPDERRVESRVRQAGRITDSPQTSSGSNCSPCS